MEAVERLRAADSATTFAAQPPVQPPSVVFLFPGQGAQFVNMGRELYEFEPVFREAADRCAECLQKRLQLDIRSVLYPEAPFKAQAEQQINETRVTQPTIFTVEYALACLWMSWGIKPSLLIGHSVGEYVAAVLAKVFTLEDAIAVLAGRAKLMQDLPSGSMLAVRRGVAGLEGSLPEGVAVAAINSPFLTTLSGPTPTLLDLQKTFEASGIFCRLLPTSHAFHSSMMDPIVEQFTKLAGSVRQQKSTLPWISTYTGTWMDDQATLDGSYWASQLRRTVRFGQAVETAIKNGATTFLEVGPGQALTQLVLQQPSKPSVLTALTSLGPCDDTPADVESMLTSLGRLWLSGIEPDWLGFYSTEKRTRLALPTYPFERKSYWIAPPTQSKQVLVQSVSKGAERNDNGNGVGAAAKPEVSPFVGHAQPSPAPQPMVAAATQSSTCRVIEKQVQLMAQQLEMLRKRVVRGKSESWQTTNGAND